MVTWLQATSLIIRSLAVRELELSDWVRVMKRELLSGVALGSILERSVFCALCCGLRAWRFMDRTTPVSPWSSPSAWSGGPFGTLVGSMLPFCCVGWDLIQRLHRPRLSRLVDVSGLVITSPLHRSCLGLLLATTAPRTIEEATERQAKRGTFVSISPIAKP